jgi:hypothetical protein
LVIAGLWSSYDSWIARSFVRVKQLLLKEWFRMGRFPQGLRGKGSQRWMQWLVNDAPERLNESIGLGPIDWRSPVGADDYAEYRDQAFLDLLGIDLQTRPLRTFWPFGGPQRDGLGRATSGEVVLVEAKAHLNELYSSATGPSESSLMQIQSSLSETACGLGVRPGYDWSKQFYQYGNRLAHAYLLDQLNGIPTRLVFLYLIGDEDVHGPATRGEWDAASHTVHHALGLLEAPAFVTDVFMDVRECAAATP